MADFNEMDALELPEMNENDYTDIPDASDDMSADTETEEPIVTDMDDDFSDMPMPVLSEMDGSDIASPAEQASKGGSASSDIKASVQPMFEDMSAPARQQRLQTDNSSSASDVSRRTYQSSSSAYQSPSGTGSSGSYRNVPSMDDFYSARMAVDPEKHEKGRKKTRIVAGVGIGLYAYNTLSYLASLLGGGGLSVILDLGISGFLLYLFIRFFRGSNTAKDTLAWWIGIDVVFNIIGLVTAGISAAAFSSFGIGGIFGLLAVMGFITLIARGVMLYFLVLDDDISEYSKNKQ